MEQKRTRTEGQRALRCVDVTGTAFVAVGGCVAAQGSKPQVGTAGCFVAICPAATQGIWAVSTTGAVVRVVMRPAKEGGLHVTPAATVPQPNGSPAITACCWCPSARGSLVLGRADGSVLRANVDTGSSELVNSGEAGPVRWTGASKSGRLAVLLGDGTVLLFGGTDDAAPGVTFRVSDDVPTGIQGGLQVAALCWCDEVLVALCLVETDATASALHPCVLAMQEDEGCRRCFAVVESIRGSVLSRLGGMAATSTWLLESAGDHVRLIAPNHGASIDTCVFQPPGLQGALWRVADVAD